MGEEGGGKEIGERERKRKKEKRKERRRRERERKRERERERERERVGDQPARIQLKESALDLHYQGSARQYQHQQ